MLLLSRLAMPPLRPPLPRFRPGLLILGAMAALALALLGLARWAWSPVGRTRGPRVMVLLEPDPGLTAPEVKGLEVLVRDHLECHGRCTLLPWVPDGDPRLPSLEAAGVVQARLRPRREGSLLAWEVAWTRTRQGPWTKAQVAPAAPSQAFMSLGSSLPGLGLNDPEPTFVPPGQGFWALVEAVGLSRLKRDEPRALDLTREVLQHTPDCATAHVTLALLLLRTGVADPVRQEQVLGSLNEALRLQPGHPRISYVAASILVEMGRHREALDLLRSAVAAHPDLPDPLQGVVYAARTSGLLELAGRAHRAQERLLLGPPPRLPLLVLLYRQELGAFEQHCRDGAAQTPTPAHFYLGYLALARGQRQAALHAFERAGQPVTPGWEDLGTLASVWSLHLSGRTPEARTALADLERRRAADRAPDGEFTFMLAEARGLLGDSEEGLDLAQRAFAQGFACTEWYLHSPFLQGPRQLPRWRELEAHLQARQRLLESRFPPSAFGL